MTYSQLPPDSQRQLQIEAAQRTGFGRAYVYHDYPDHLEKKGLNAPMRKIALAETGRNSIFLGGNPDAGKTTLMAIFCKDLFHQWALLESKADPKYLPESFALNHRLCSHTELSKMWEHEFDDNSDFGNPEYYITAPVLFLDDLGAAPENTSGRNLSRIEDLVEYRCANRLKTFVTTNFDPEKIYVEDIKRKNYLFGQWHRTFRRLMAPEWTLTLNLPERFHEPIKQITRRSKK